MKYQSFRCIKQQGYPEALRDTPPETQEIRDIFYIMNACIQEYERASSQMA